jgi:bacteriocin biosynthesis cyclodehydratase domain-containing protein
VTVYRLRPSIELFPASTGELHLLIAGERPDLVIRDPQPADRALLERLEQGDATRAQLAAAAGVDGDELAGKLGDLDAAGVLLARTPAESPLSLQDAERFDRQLPYFAETGDPVLAQRRLLEATVVVLGCGGLGTWALGALASAGVRRFVLIDDDLVELSNLNRQILYATADVGQPKVVRAAEWLRRFDPRCDVRPLRRRIERAGDLAPLLAGADVLVHAADRPPYDILRWADAACREAGVPYITAGQLPPVLKIGPTYVPGRSACFACHEAGLHDAFPLFAEVARFRRDHGGAATTLGPASGVVGTLLAMEVMHLLTGDAPVATEGHALLLDMRTLQTRWEAIERRPDCPACAPLH